MCLQVNLVKKRKKAFNTAQCEHLLLQPFDSVPVSALSSAQRPFDIPKARPQPLRLPLGLLALPHQTLAQTVRLLHLSQLCLLMKHTHARTHTHGKTTKCKRRATEHLEESQTRLEFYGRSYNRVKKRKKIIKHIVWTRCSELESV